MAIKVAPKRGIAVCRPMRVVAPFVFSGFQVYQYAVYDDDSIVYQHAIASTKAADDCVASFPPANKGTERTEYGDDIRLIPMMRPLLNPIAIISISTTMMTDSIRLMTKVPKELPTRSG